MRIEQLNATHREAVKQLFTSKKHMGLDHRANYFVEPDAEFLQILYDNFCDTYLSGLKNFKAFGAIENDAVTAMIAFYESVETPDWYWTQIRSKNRKAIPMVLDEVAAYNEKNGRLKFYSLFNSKYAKTYRKLAFSKTMNERYGFFDEFIVPEKAKCFYLVPWQVLFNRVLVPAETLVRCTYLKQEYRQTLPIAGGL